jgi:hypothetical protein
MDTLLGIRIEKFYPPVLQAQLAAEFMAHKVPDL